MTNVPTHPTLAEALDKIVGSALSSVTFVADYIQLAFDGPCLTAYTMPTITVEFQRLRWNEPGYRDALCRQISRHIESVEVDDKHVSILFEGGAAMSVSLLDEECRGPEALQLSLNQDRFWVV